MNCMNCGSPLSSDVKFCPKCGTPNAQPAPYAPPVGQTPPSWGGVAPQSQQQPRRKSRVGKILLILFSVLLVIGVGAGLAIYFGYRYVESSVKSSEAYQLAERELKRSPAAAEKLGEIKSMGFPLGAFKTDADGSGSAAFTSSVEGTKGSGQYVVAMSREGGKWSITSAFLRLPNGETINVAGEGEGGSDSSSSDSGNGAGDAAGPGNADDSENSGATTGGTIIPGGVLNGKAISKPAPVYPMAAKAVHASGTVSVNVVVDESGRVVSANAFSGHPLLQQAAASAARQARFSPTMLSGQPVKVSGILTYQFEAQ